MLIQIFLTQVWKSKKDKFFMSLHSFFPSFLNFIWKSLIYITLNDYKFVINWVESFKSQSKVVDHCFCLNKKTSISLL